MQLVAHLMLVSAVCFIAFQISRFPCLSQKYDDTFRLIDELGKPRA